MFYTNILKVVNWKELAMIPLLKVIFSTKRFLLAPKVMSEMCVVIIGIGQGRVTNNMKGAFDDGVFDDAIHVPDEDSVEMVRTAFIP